MSTRQPASEKDWRALHNSNPLSNQCPTDSAEADSDSSGTHPILVPQY